MEHQQGSPDWVRIVRALADESKVEAVKERYAVKVPNSRRRIKIRELLDDYDQSDLFDTRAQKIAWEEHFLGIALSGSESDIYKAKDHCIDLVKGGYPDMRFEISVCVDGVREIITKKGDPMAFVTAHDRTYLMDNIVVFPKVFNTSKQLLEGGNVLKIKGKVDDRGSLIADRVERLK
jgi:DNA polymerase III alpha subunit